MVDVAVIGAGVMGASVAFHLANGRPFEAYRRLTVDGALARLASPSGIAGGAEGSHQGGSVSKPG